MVLEEPVLRVDIHHISVCDGGTTIRDVYTAVHGTNVLACDTTVELVVREGNVQLICCGIDHLTILATYEHSVTE